MRYLSDHSVDVGRRIPGGEGERGGLVWRSNGDQICVGIFFFLLWTGDCERFICQNPSVNG